jgi:hypothetical protein
LKLEGIRLAHIQPGAAILGFVGRLRQWLRKGRVWIVAVGVLLLALWTVGGSESFQSCREGDRPDFEDAAFYKTAAVLEPAAGDSLEACLGYFLEENAAAITALSVLMTALFTGILSLATVRLWDSTKGLHEETKQLTEITKTQSQDMKTSIAEAVRAAAAVERVADPTKTGSDNPSGP